MANLGNEKMTVTGLEEEMYMKLKEIVRTERNIGRVQVKRNPDENLLVDVDMLNKEMTVEDDLSTTAPNRNLVEFKFNSSLTKPRSPSLKIAKTEASFRRQPRVC